MLSGLSDWLWQESVWLPPNSSWEHLEDRDGLEFAHPRHMLAALPVALGLLGLRLAFERFLALPLGRRMGLRDPVRRRVRPDPALERHFLSVGRRPEEAQLVLLAARSGLSPQQTQRWFRRRRNLERTPPSRKFCEACWRFVFYLTSFLTGLSVLYHEPWFWTPSLCWENYPRQPLNLGLYRWFLLELGFYLSLILTLPFDTRRKDFREQVVHHFVAVGLIGFSYSANLLRIGSVVLMLHDCSDYLLEACKVLNYTHYRKTCNALFLVFAGLFFYTRLVLFPTRVLHTTLTDSVRDSGPFFGYYFFNALLLALQLLHGYWFLLILRMLGSFLRGQPMSKDIRSDVDSESSEDEATATATATPDPLGPRRRAATRLTNGDTRAAAS